MEKEKKQIVKTIDEMKAPAVRDSETIWEYAEPGLLEFKSSKLLMKRLRENDFEVENGTGGMESAFIGSWGSGAPVIGLLAEYDALETCGPPIGEPGHGCGHNLLGTAVVYAAIALKKVMQKDGLKGTVKVYGCPAEEKLIGKIYMARDGAFDGLDAVITWHPGVSNNATTAGRNALDSFSFRFTGRTAHSASDPWNGRSAPDAVEVMNYGVNMMREHIPEAARIHYVITEGGGQPNVVPPEAISWYYVRAPARRGKDGVEDISARVKGCAEGAALATGTELEIKHLTAVYETCMSLSGADLMQRNLEYVGPPRFTEEERSYAKEVGLEAGMVLGDLDETISPTVTERRRGTNDYGTVSYLAPLLHCNITCAATGTPGHHFAGALQYKSSMGQKGMMVAAKVMACAAMDLLNKPDEMAKIRDEHMRKTEGFEFDAIIPKDQKPPISDGYHE